MGKKKETGGGRKTSANAAPSASGQNEDDRRGAADDGEAFWSRFWAVYPRHDAREAARKAFARAINDGVDPETMIAGAQRYAITEQARIAREHTPKYTAHAATWLNGRRWEDPFPPGTVVDNETGNVVAVEQPPSQHSGGGDRVMEIYEATRAELAKTDPWWAS